jgi:hypothetical protein
MLSDLKMKKDLHRLIKLLINGYNAFILAFYDSLRVDFKIY